MPLSDSPAHDIDALWPLCLEIARRRRAGAEPAAPGGAIDWRGAEGYALQGRWDAGATLLFALLKPLLDLPADGPNWAVGQLGQSLDGCVATQGGDSNFVNGPQVLVHLHRLRALSDAVVVGAGTVSIDNPRLSTRRVRGPNPVRVVLDPGLRVPATAQVFTDGAAPTLLVCDVARQSEAAARVGAERVLGVPELVAGPGTPGASLDLAALQSALRARGLRVLFVEGGGVTVSRFMAQGRLDRLHLSVAPVLIGGGRPGLQLPRAAAMQDALWPPCRLFTMGNDVLWDLDLRAAPAQVRRSAA